MVNIVQNMCMPLKYIFRFTFRVLHIIYSYSEKSLKHKINILFYEHLYRKRNC